MEYPHFRFYKRQDILNLTRLRRFETKLGECLQTINDAPLTEAIAGSKAKFVLLGIPEDIGIAGNYGTGGADTAWLPFLQSFCNVQSTDIFTGEEVLALGHFDFTDVKALIMANAKSQDEMIDACRHAVANIIDTEVEALIKQVAATGKTPIVIGGGHNNAYPLIKGTAKGLHKAGMLNNSQINVINADAQGGYLHTEGRHSGNSFRYAMEEGFLKKYAIIGLQENYNSQRMLDELYSNINIQYSFFEDISVREKFNFRQAVVQAISFTEESFTGIELSLNCIEQALSSGGGKCGFTALQARQYISFAASYAQVVYLHICEGAAQLTNGQSDAYTGRIISDLVSDFIKAGNV
jgi:formiminoglutamase